MKRLVYAALMAITMLGVAATSASAFDFSRHNKITVYMAKFLCGDGNFSQSQNAGVIGGFYATAINIGNPNNQTIEIQKQLVFTETVSAGNIPDRTGQMVRGPIQQTEFETLDPYHAFEWDCGVFVPNQLSSVRNGGFIKGFLIIKVDAPDTIHARRATVTAVYTNQNKEQDDDQNNPQLVSVDVEHVPGVETRAEPLLLGVQ